MRSTDITLTGTFSLFSLNFTAKSITDITQTKLDLYGKEIANNSGTFFTADDVDSTVTILIPDHIAVTGGVSTVAVPTLKENNGSTTTAPFTATVYGSTGEEVKDQPIEWSVAKGTDTNPAGVSIGTDGAVTVTKDAAAGTYVVTATSGSYTAGTKEFTVTRSAPVLTQLVFENRQIGGFEFTNNSAAVTVNGNGSGLMGQLQNSDFTAIDQFGVTMADQEISYGIYTEETLQTPYQPADINNPEISINNGLLYVSPTAASHTYYIKASSGDVYTVLAVDVTRLYNITAVNVNTTNAHGTSDIAPYAIAGNNVQFSVTPNKGYKIKEVLLGSTTLTTADGKYSFIMPAADATITVNYILEEPAFDVESASVETTYGLAKDVVIIPKEASDELAYSFQWYYSTSKTPESFSILSGAVAASYRTPDDLQCGEHYYLCRVTVDDGDENISPVTVNSPIITVTVNKAVVSAAPQAKQIRYNDPADKTLDFGTISYISDKPVEVTGITVKSVTDADGVLDTPTFNGSILTYSLKSGLNYDKAGATANIVVTVSFKNHIDLDVPLAIAVLDKNPINVTYTYTDTNTTGDGKNIETPYTKTYDGSPFSYDTDGKGQVVAKFNNSTDVTSEIDGWTYTWYEGTTRLGDTPADAPSKAGSYLCIITADDTEYAGGTMVYFTIAPKTVRVLSGITASNKEYDSTTSAVLNGGAAVLDAVVSGDTLTVTAAGAFEDKNVGTGKTVNITQITLGGEDAGNYALAETGNQETAAADITAKAVTVSGITAADRDYNKETGATLSFSNVTFNGKFEGDKLTLSADGAFSDANAGEGKTVSITNLTLGGDDAGNYVLAQTGNQETATATIRPMKADALTFEPIADITYDGGEHKPAATVKNDGTTLAAGTDYDTAWPDAEYTNAAEHNISLTFKGNYTGAKTVTFKIVPKALSNDDVNFASIEAQPYTGAEIRPEPAITLKAGGATLKKNIDYTLSYSNNTEPGNNTTVVPTVTANFQGNYGGSASTNFVIRKLTAIEITASPTKTAYYITGLTALDKAGLSVTAHYSDGHTAVVPNNAITVLYAEGGAYGAGGLDKGDTTVTLSYTEGTVTKTAQLPVSVDVKRVTGLAFTGSCKDAGYYEGQVLDRTGLTITATFNDGTSQNVTNAAAVTYYNNDGNPADGKTAFVATGGATKVKFKYTATFSGETSTATSAEMAIGPVGATVVWVVGANTYKVNCAYGANASYIYDVNDDTRDPAKNAPAGSVFAGWNDGTKEDDGQPRIYTSDVSGKLLYKGNDIYVTGNVTYKAMYLTSKYTVTFKDSDGNIMNTQTVAHGKAAAAPTPPAIAGSAFKGWNDGSAVYTVLPAVYGNMIYIAEYAKNTYTVTYYDENGAALNKTELVKHGDSINPGFVPEKASDAQNSYVFDKWVTTAGGNVPVGAITANTSVYASYIATAKGYTYRFLNEDGTLLSSGTLQYNEAIPAPANPTKPSDAQYSYSFTGFSGYTANMPITANVTFYATYKSNVRSYTVTWSVDGKTTAEVYEYGATPSFKGSTGKTADDKIYTFKGWDKALSPVAADITYTAQYDVTDKAAETFTVTFLNDDKTEISKLTVNKGERPTAPAASKARDSQHSYVLKGWSDGKTVYAPASLPLAAADATYTAVYLSVDILYTVVFTDHDDRVLSVATYKSGTKAEDIVKPKNPARTDVQYNYTFTGWSPTVTDVTSDAVYTAQYSQSAKSFTLTINKSFSDNSKAPVKQTVNVEYGKTYNVPIEAETGYTAYVNGSKTAAPTYTTQALTADSSVTLVYRPNKYKITTECLLGAETVLYERSSAVYKGTVTVLIPSRRGYKLYLGDVLLDAGYAYTLSNNGSGWTAEQGAAVPVEYTLIRMTYNIDGDSVLQLEYMPETYTVTYELSFGDGSRIDSDIYGLQLDTGSIGYNVLEADEGTVSYKYFTKDYKYGEAITPPTVSIYSSDYDTSSFLWSGWAGLPEEMPDTDITVTGKFTAGQHLYRYVIYDQNGNPVDYYRQRSDGDADLNLLCPQGDGYDYSPWSYELGLMDADSAITLYSNQTLPAYDLTINYNIGAAEGREVSYTVGNASGTKTVTNGKIIIEDIPYNTEYSVLSPEITGYTAQRTNVSGKMDAQGKTIDVAYDVNSYLLTVNYSYSSGLPIKTYSETVAFGSSYSISSDTVAGYTPSIAALSGTMGAGDKTFEVIYTPNKYDLSITYTYDTVSGATAAPAYTLTQLDYGTVYNIPSPVIEGYTASKTTVSGTVTGNIAESIIYTSGEFTISYYVEGETTVVHRYDTGETITPYSAPAKEGYTFSGWTWSSGSEPATMPSGNLIVTGYYTKNSYKLTVTFDSNVAAGTKVDYKIDNGTTQQATVADGKIEIMVPYQSTCVVTAPAVEGYTASETSVSVTMGAADVSRSFTYTKKSTGGDSGGTTTTKTSDTVNSTDGKVTSTGIASALKAGTGTVNISTKTESAILAASDAKKIADNKAELTVKTGSGSVTISSEGLGELISKTDADELKVVVDEPKNDGSTFKIVAGDEVLGEAEVSIYLGSKEITSGFGKLNISIPVGKLYGGWTVSVMHLKDDGSYTIIDAVVDVNGNALFSVDSLSSFIVLKHQKTPVTSIFKDVKSGDWYEGYVQYAYDEGLMTGVTASEFAPHSSASRAMIVTVLWRMAGGKTGNKDAGFTDLTQDWYKEAVNWAFANGITTGKSATEFDPNAAVTREQLAAFLYRFSKFAGKDISKTKSLDSFTDAAGVSSYAVTAMKWAAASGIINGRTETTLVPAGTSTRAELATMLTRLK